MITKNTVIQQFLFYIMADLPEPAMKAWLRSLSDVEREEVIDYILSVFDAFQPLIDCMKRMGERIVSGMRGGINETNQRITEESKEI